MKSMTWCSAVLVLAVACKQNDDKKAEPPPKVVDKQPPEPAKPALADVTVTSTMPEALKAFEEGRNLVDHSLGNEAEPHFKKAVEIDPDFAQAHAYLGAVTGGAEGIAQLAKATTLMSTLPEAEQQLITAMQAQRAGDTVKARAAYTKVLELAPGAWRADIVLANMANRERNANEAIRRLEHALTIKPDLATAYNGLAYARAGQREWKPAIAAAKKQVELLPKEPNPHDTLGEILLSASKFDDAEQEFFATVELQPRFTLAWQGVGLARGYRGDFKGAHEATAKRIAVNLDIDDKVDAMIDDAWISLAEGKLPAALATLDAIDADPAAKTSRLLAFASIDRGYILSAAGKYADAAKALVTAQTRTDQLAGNAKQEATMGVRLATLRNAALAGKPAADAAKLVAASDEDAKAQAGSTRILSMAAYARGLAAWAKQDLKGAVAELQKCDPELTMCRFDLARAQRKTGDAAGAQTTEDLLRATPRREMPGVYFAAQLPKRP